MSCPQCKLLTTHASLRDCIQALRLKNDELLSAWVIEHRDSEEIERELDLLRPVARAAKALYIRVRLYSWQEISAVKQALLKAGYLKHDPE